MQVKCRKETGFFLALFFLLSLFKGALKLLVLVVLFLVVYLQVVIPTGKRKSLTVLPSFVGEKTPNLWWVNSG